MGAYLFNEIWDEEMSEHFSDKMMKLRSCVFDDVRDKEMSKNFSLKIIKLRSWGLFLNGFSMLRQKNTFFCLGSKFFPSPLKNCPLEPILRSRVATPA
jgi:hypothetical protein